MDRDIAALLLDDTIRLIKVSWLADLPDETVFQRRQDLPRDIFLSATDAAALLLSAKRKVFVFSYPWLSPKNPDPYARVHLRRLKTFFNNPALCPPSLRAEAGVFIDFMCIPQYPRSDAEATLFSRALEKMSDLYASALGTTVLQSRGLARREDPDEGREEWQWNDTPYENRGWCVLESALSDEAVGRSTRHPEMKAAMEQIGQAKVYELFTEQEPRVRSLAKVQGAHEIAKIIRRSKFTGKQDRDIVCSMFESYQRRIAEAGLFIFGKKHLKELLKGDFEALDQEAGPNVKLFVSSTFTDTQAERNHLMQHVYPPLRTYCASLGLQLRVVDLRWGIRDDSTDNHATNQICLREVVRCREKSVGPCFLYLAGGKYGTTSPPLLLPKAAFEALQQHADPSLVQTGGPFFQELGYSQPHELLGTWYRLDSNLVPPQYRLVPISHVTGTVDAATNGRVFTDAREQLLVLLRAAAEKAVAAGALDAALRDAFHISVTHEEVRAALGAPERAAIFSREIRGGDGYEPASWVEAAGSEAAKLLQQCRSEAAAKMHTAEFSTALEGASAALPAAYLQQLGESVRAYVQAGVTQALQNQQPLDAISQEVMRHAALCRSRARGFSAREALLEATVARIRSGGGRVTIVHGRSGSGKTSLLARASKEVGDGWTAEAEAARERGDYGLEPIVAIRFCGITPDSSNARVLLRSLCEQLASVYDKPPPPSDEWKRLVEDFRKRLLEAPAGRKLAIFIDSLDQLTDDYQARSDLSVWLPTSALPPHVHVVVSCIPDDEYKVFAELQRRDLPQECYQPVELLGAAEVDLILDGWLRHDERALTDAQRAVILQAAGSEPTSLKLRALYDLSPQWRSFDVPGEPPKPGSALPPVVPKALPSDVPAIIDHVFARLEKQHGEVLVRHTFSYLALSVAGLSAEELMDLLSMDDAVLQQVLQYHSAPQRRLPPLVFHLISNELMDHLIERGADGAPVLGWYHRQWWEAAERRYAREPALNALRASTMADYFAASWKERPGTVTVGTVTHSWADEFAHRGLPEQPLRLDKADGSTPCLNARKLAELPSALTKAARWEELAAMCLCNLDFVQTKCEAGMAVELVEDYDRALGEAAALSDFPQIQRDLIAFRAFIKAQSHQLTQMPDLTLQQACNEPDTSPVSQIAWRTVRASAKLSTPLLEFVNKPQLRSIVLFTLEGHTDTVSAVRFLNEPGAQKLLTASMDCSIRVWDLNTGQQIYGLRLHTTGISQLAVAPDDATFCSADKSGVLMLFDTETGNKRAEGRTIKGQYGGDPYRLQYTADGSKIVTASGTCLWPGMPPGHICVFRSADLKMLGIPLAFSLDRQVHLITPDGSKALIAHFSDNWHTFFDLGCNKWEVWDLTIPAGLEHDIYDRSDPIVALDGESPDPVFYRNAQGGPVSYVDTEGSLQEPVKLYWVTASGKRLRRHFIPQRGPDGPYANSRIPFGHVYAMERVLATFDGVASRPVLVGNDFVAKDAAPAVQRQQTGSFPWGIDPLDKYGQEVLQRSVKGGLAARLDKRTGDGLSVHVWQMGASAPAVNLPLAKLVGHTAPISSVVFAPDDSLVATASEDRTVNIYAPAANATTQDATAAAGQLRKIASNAADGHARSASVASADGTRMIMLRNDSVVELWNAHELERKFTSHLGLTFAVAMHPSGRLAASAGEDCTIAVYDCDARQEVLSITVDTGGAQEPAILGLAFSPAQPVIASCGTDHVVTLFGYKAGAAKRPWEGHMLLRLEGHHRWVKSLAFSADDTCLVSGAFENQMLLWRREGATWGSGSVSKEPLVLPHWSTPAVYCLAFDAAAKYVASGSEEGDVVVHTLTADAKLYGVRQPRLGMLWQDQLFNSAVVTLAIEGELLLAAAVKEKAVRVHKVANGHALAVYRVACVEPLACLNLILPPARAARDAEANATVCAMTSSGRLMRLRMHNLGAEDLESIDSFSENVIQTERKERRPYEKDLSLPDAEAWHRFAAKEFAADAERDETTLVGREAKTTSKGTAWVVSRTDGCHATTHERVVAFPAEARADGRNLTFEQILPPGKYEVAWRVKPIKDGVPADYSIRKIIFSARVGRKATTQQHVFEWSTEEQVARPWQAGWSTLYTGQVTVVDKPRTVCLTWYTVPAIPHGPMTSGIDSVDSIMVRNVTALPSDTLSRLGAQEGATSDGRLRKGEQVFIQHGAEDEWCRGLVFEDEEEGAEQLRVVPLAEEKKEAKKADEPVVPKEKLKRTPIKMAWGAQATVEQEASPEEIARRVADFWREKEAAAISKPREAVRRYARPGDVAAKDDVLIIGPDQKPLKCRVEKARGLLLSLVVIDERFGGIDQNLQQAFAPYMPGKNVNRPLTQCMPLGPPPAAATVTSAGSEPASRKKFGPFSRQGSRKTHPEPPGDASGPAPPSELAKKPSKFGLLGLSGRLGRTARHEQRASVTCLRHVEGEGAYDACEVKLVGLVPEKAAASGALTIMEATLGDDVVRLDVTKTVQGLLQEGGSRLELTVNDATLGDVEKAAKTGRKLRVAISAEAMRVADLATFTFDAAADATLRIDRRDRAILQGEQGGFFTAPLAELEPSEAPLKSKLRMGDELFASPTRDAAFVVCRLLGETDGAGQLVVFDRTGKEHALPLAALRLRSATDGPRGKERDKWLRLWERQLKGLTHLKVVLGAGKAAAEGGSEPIDPEQTLATFKLIDTDQNNELSREEFAAVLESLGIEPPQGETHQIFESIDEDGNGAISLEEFTKFVQTWRANVDTSRNDAQGLSVGDVVDGYSA